ncbi:sterol C-22 desaturase [Viridothelium virens]|uniref:sterol 22-desaturase n=1 Tax=Viridothelium virens TaxID=1048519 RepID=A0A6A6GWR7_VIRVR|nr:sterol C-22 desaturase [Viridothelium virens]
MGPFLESVDPKFHKYQEKWNSGDLSCVSVFHKFVVIASSRDMARKIFNAPTYVKPCVTDAAHKLLRPTNWVFLDGQAHADYRKGLNGLFTRKALELYLPSLEEVQVKYLETFLDVTERNGGNAVPFMPHFRVLMCAVSCRTFVGKYMPEEMIKKIADNHYQITAALELVNFPIILPFTRTWYGKKCADMVIEEFTKCAAKAKLNMLAGGKAECIMDAWILSMIASEEYRKKVAEGVEIPQKEKPDMLIRWFDDVEISMTVFTFLFASQDASSSACTWLFQLMADRPDILNRVREENLSIRCGDRDKPLTLNMTDNMIYTRAVVKETLRYRPPVIMVPHIAKENFSISEHYTIPKGSMVVPATYPSLHDPDVYPNPETYDPERWITGGAEQQCQNWLVFGTGPHHCIGQNYVILNLVALVRKASMKLKWKHYITPESEDIKLFATIFPRDDCFLTFEKRLE